MTPEPLTPEELAAIRLRAKFIAELPAHDQLSEDLLGLLATIEAKDAETERLKKYLQAAVETLESCEIHVGAPIHAINSLKKVLAIGTEAKK